MLAMLIAGAISGLALGLLGNLLSGSPGFAVILPIIASVGGVILGLAIAILALSLRALLGRFVRGRVLDFISAVLASALASWLFFLVLLGQQGEWNAATFVVVSTLLGTVVGTATFWLARRRATQGPHSNHQHPA